MVTATSTYTRNMVTNGTNIISSAMCQRFSQNQNDHLHAVRIEDGWIVCATICAQHSTGVLSV